MNIVLESYGRDIIFAIAPGVKIVPVSVDARNYWRGMQYIANRSDVQIVNISRAFAVENNKIEGKFLKALLDALATKVVTKNRCAGTEPPAGMGGMTKQNGIGMSLLVAKDVKKILRCSLPLVYKLAERGQLPCVR